MPDAVAAKFNGRSQTKKPGNKKLNAYQALNNSTFKCNRQREEEK